MPQQFGPEENPITVFSRAMRGGFDPVALRGLRESRLREMERNRDFQDDSRIEQAIDRSGGGGSAASRQRDRMMGWDLGTPTFTTGATKSDVRNLRQDADEDPDTGLEAQARTSRIARTLDDAATTQRQEVGDAVDVTSRRNAFAEFLKNKGAIQGKAAGEISDEGTQALDAASQRRRAEFEVQARGRLAARAGGVPIAELRPGDDPMEGLSEQQKGIIKGLLDYTYKVPGGSVLKSPEWMDLLGRAKLIDPSFDQTQYDARQNMRTDKKFQENMQSLATVQDHAAMLEKKAKGLDNYEHLGPLTQPVNEFKNWWNRKSGDAAIQGYDISRGLVSTEIAKAVKGSVITGEEAKEWNAKMTDALSPSQQAETFRAFGDLIKARVGAGTDRYDTVMGKPGAYRTYQEQVKQRAADAGAGTTPGAPQEGDTKPLDANGAEATFQGGRWIRTR